MNKRKPDADPTGPRKKVKSDRLHDALNSQMSNANTATASTSMATSQRREKRKRVDEKTAVDTLDQGLDTSRSTKRAKTQSPYNTIDYRTIPGFQPWPSTDDDPQSEFKYWEDEYYTKDLTEEKKRFREQAVREEQGYYKCACGKYHCVIGRKSYHFEDGTPEPDSGSELEQAETRAHSAAASTHRNQGQDLLPSPGLSDRETDTGHDQLESAPIDISFPRALLNVPDPQVHRAHSLPPILSEVSPTSPTLTISKAQVLRLPNKKRDVERSARQRQTHEKMSKVEKINVKGKNKKKKIKRIKKNEELTPTPVVEELMYSSRSSRRDPGSRLWFLGDRGKACLVAAPSR
ncbi:hypothetical protein V8C37DRAFT_379878 [Trichoderma ceciliae]